MADVNRLASGARVLGELTISELVYRSQRYLRVAFSVFLGILLVGALSALLRGGAIYLAGYLLVVAGLVPPIAFWIFSIRRNIPLVPSLALVNLVWNALPLAFANPMLQRYTNDEILQGTGEIFVFGVSLTSIYLLISARLPGVLRNISDLPFPSFNPAEWFSASRRLRSPRALSWNT